MSYSAQTEKLRLPQWVQGSKDHPDFLTDVNQAFEKIDGFAQGIDNTVDGLPEQVEEVATILQSVQEDVGEHTEELVRQGVQIGILQAGMGDAARLATRVSALEDGQREQDGKIDSLGHRIYEWKSDVHNGIEQLVFTDLNDSSNSVKATVTAAIGNVVKLALDLDDVKGLGRGSYALKASTDATEKLFAKLGIVTERLNIAPDNTSIYMNPGGIVFAMFACYYANGVLQLGALVQNDPHQNTVAVIGAGFIWGYEGGNITDAESRP